MKTDKRGTKSTRRHSAVSNRKPSRQWLTEIGLIFPLWQGVQKQAFSGIDSVTSSRIQALLCLPPAIFDIWAFHSWACGLMATEGLLWLYFQRGTRREGGYTRELFSLTQHIAAAAEFLFQKSFSRLSANSLARTGFLVKTIEKMK